MNALRTRPLLVDLFCCEGGASTGYHRAGFDVIGVDIVPQPLYPFPMVVADAMNVPLLLEHADAIHASPPCQRYSTMGNRARREAPDLLAATIDMLREIGRPFIVENVTGARTLMPDAVQLTGGMFGLRVHRPRLFTSNVLLLAPRDRRRTAGTVGVYGRVPDGRRLWGQGSRRYKNEASLYAADGLEDARDAMGMPWASWNGCREAIPPAYTEFLGHQLMMHVTTEVAR